MNRWMPAIVLVLSCLFPCSCVLAEEEQSPPSPAEEKATSPTAEEQSPPSPTEEKVAPPTAKEIFLYKSAIDFLGELSNEEENCSIQKEAIVVLDTWLSHNTLMCPAGCHYCSSPTRCPDCIGSCSKLPSLQRPKCVACCLAQCCRKECSPPG